MPSPLVAGNWKMHGDRRRLAALTADIAHATKGLAHAEVALLPPYVYLQAVAAALAGSKVRLGAQDLDYRDQGALTGAVAADMLKDLGCVYALVGHSERRQLFGEDDRQVALKFAKALAAGLTPILCLGETLPVREAGGALEWVGSQLQAVLDEVGGAGMAQGLLAYEPVWAIGTGKSASPEEAQEVHAHLRARLKAAGAPDVRLLYGGSVTEDNAKSLFAQPDIDGALVGGASLKAQTFAKICHLADEET